MSLSISINITGGLDEDLRRIAAELEDKKPLHARIAGEAEIFIKAAGQRIAASDANHRSANALGATPTGHLVDAYEAIESASDDEGAFLLIPPASRLRAAFGEYTITPGAGKTFLTIPVAKDSYGKRAGEFGDEIFYLLTGPKRTPVLARRQERKESASILNRSRKGKRYDNAKPLEVLYILTTKSTIKEDRGLIPFDELADEAADVTADYLDEVLEGGLA